MRDRDEFGRFERKLPDLTGMIFGNITVLKEIGKTKHGAFLYKCKCICGNEKNIVGASLTSKLTTSCGCIQKLSASLTMGWKYKDITGKKFGRLTAIENIFPSTKRHGAIWKCICECGRETIVQNKNITNGSVKSCGCLRIESMKKNRCNPEDSWKIYKEKLK